MNGDTFWIVWGEGKGTPTFKHMTFEAAKTEAKRLARNNPDRHFHVMERKGTAVKNDVSFYVRHENPYDTLDCDESPF